MLDSSGYLRLTDFGIARIWKPKNSEDISGTPGYMAPEVLQMQNHGIAADYYALGIIMHECIFKQRPFSNVVRKEILKEILEK
jgi:serine/threonine protein kinase